MLNLDRNEFEKYYYSKIVPLLPELENERKSVLLKKKIIICSIIIFAFVISILNEDCVTVLDYIIGTLIIFFMFFVPVSSIIHHRLVKKYQKNLKEKVYKPLFRILDIIYSNETEDISKIEKSIKSFTLRHSHSVNIDDIFTGNYKELNYIVADTTFYSRNTNYISDGFFCGLFLSAHINKKFNNKTIIKSNRLIGHSSNMNKINCNNAEFEKFFEVYSENIAESNELVNPDFMEKLKNYYLQKQYLIKIIFANINDIEQNMFIFISTWKDHFELPINKTLYDSDLFYNIFTELYDTLEIFNVL